MTQSIEVSSIGLVRTDPRKARQEMGTHPRCETYTGSGNKVRTKKAAAGAAATVTSIARLSQFNARVSDEQGRHRNAESEMFQGLSVAVAQSIAV